MFKRLISLLLCLMLLPVAPAYAEAGAAPTIQVTLDRESYYAGMYHNATATIQYNSTVTDSIRLVNRHGEELAVAENDGSGLAVVEFRLYEPYAGQYCVTGECGAVQSEKCFYTVEQRVVQGRASADMVSTLHDVCSDIISTLDAQNIADPDSPEAMAAVYALLASDSRIDSYGENNGNIIFRTTDGLMGFYGFHASDELVFGDSSSVFTPLDTAYTQYVNDNLADGTVIASDIPVTNTGILFVAPQLGDGTIEWGRTTFQPRLQALASDLEFSFDAANGSDAVDRLIEGSITDCGLLVLMAHGGQLLTENGFMLTMNLGAFSEEQAARVADLLWDLPERGYFNEHHEKVDTPESAEHIYYVNDDTMHMLYGVSKNDDGELEYSMRATRNFLEYVLADKTFDNTVIYMVVCYAASDARLSEFLHGRGASAVIGTNDPLDAFVSMCMLEELCNMAVQQDDGTYLMLQDAVDNVDGTPTDAMLNEFYDALIALELLKPDEDPRDEFITGTLIDHAEEQLYNTILLKPRTGKTMDRVWTGTGSITGIVTNTKNEPLPDAEVRFFHWLNHDFTAAPDASFVLKTDENGRYQAENLPYGLYAVQAEHHGVPGHVTVTLDAADVEAGPVVIDPLHLFYKYLREVVVPEIGLVPEDAVIEPYNDSKTSWQEFWAGVIGNTSGLLSAAVYDFDFDGAYEMITVSIPENDLLTIEEEDRYMCMDLTLYEIVDGEVRQSDVWKDAIRMNKKNALEQDTMRVRMVEWNKQVYIMTSSFFTSGNSYDGNDGGSRTVQDGKFISSDQLPVWTYNFLTKDGAPYSFSKELDDVYASKDDLIALNSGDTLSMWNFDYFERYYNPDRNRYETTGNYICRGDDYSSLHAILRGDKPEQAYNMLIVEGTPVPTKAPEENALEDMIKAREQAVQDAVGAVAPDPNYGEERYSVDVSSSYKTGEISQVMVFGPGAGDRAVLMAKFIAAINTPELGLDADTIAALSAFDYENEWNMSFNGYDLSFGGTPSGDKVLNLIWPD